jgi:hypothetical protein
MRLLSFSFVVIASALPATGAPQAAPQRSALPATHSPARIDLNATGTLSEVLERLSRQTGMKVTYEGGTPRMHVNANLTGLTPAQAVVSVMEGLDVNYLIGLDVTSNRVETLLVVSRGGTASKPSPVRANSVPRARPNDNAPPEEDEPAEEDPMAGAVMEAMPADPASPMGLPDQPPPGAGPGVNQNIDPARGAGEPRPQLPPGFQAPPPPSGIGWSTPPGVQYGPPGGVVTPPGGVVAPSPQPGATPPPKQ